MGSWTEGLGGVVIGVRWPCLSEKHGFSERITDESYSMDRCVCVSRHRADGAGTREGLHSALLQGVHMVAFPADSCSETHSLCLRGNQLCPLPA